MNAISGFQSGLAGIYKGMNALQQDANVIASQGTTTAASSQDVTKAIVGLSANSHQVEASAKVIETQDQMLGSLLDEMA
ncbi:MAG: hypothetical protein OEM38_04530 [Gammaproteobacteria bacterium]|nr:hypothetical protein [Gammaproteobacteria bacterium]